MKIFSKEQRVTTIEVFTSLIILLGIVITKTSLFEAIAFMLSFIIILEVVRMVSDFVLKGIKAIKLRYVIDSFILFLLRDIVMVISKPSEEVYYKVGFLVAVTFCFFIFRILALKYSPSSKEYDCSEKDEKWKIKI